MAKVLNLLRQPDVVSAAVPDGDSSVKWSILKENGPIQVECVEKKEAALQLDVRIRSQVPLSFVLLQWKQTPDSGARILGDALERGYGELGFYPVIPHREMPWYFMVSDGKSLQGYGVRTSPNALASWFLDGEVTSLLLDVRCGTAGVQLGERTLEAVSLVTYESAEGESVYEAAAAFCRRMCPEGSRSKGVVYGGNNWYYAYGNCSAPAFETDCELMAELSEGLRERPYMVVDDGWQVRRIGNLENCDDPWLPDPGRFPDIALSARKARDMGVRPGIWYRPLLGTMLQEDLALTPRKKEDGEYTRYRRLDPSRKEVLEKIAADIRRIKGWGFELLKHDFSTYECLNRWGFQYTSLAPAEPWAFADRTRTSAEILKKLYQVIRESAGDMAIIGCNTISHLSAGVFDSMRVGDDTSGREWDRTRKMGVNSLAFRLPQQDAFYDVDADCVGITPDIPWELNRQWMDLVAKSGTSLFVSLDPQCATKEVKEEVREAFRIAVSKPQPARPLDWMDTLVPRTWQFGSMVKTYSWTMPGMV